MDIIQISVIALCGTILAVTVKSQRPEIGIFISVVVGMILFAISSSHLKSIFSTLQEISKKIDLNISFFEIILKILAISYICEFSSQLCKDAGENAIAVKVEMAGKILILFTSAPIILSLLELISDIF